MANFPTLFRSNNPFRELVDMQKAMDRIFDNWSVPATANDKQLSGFAFSPNCELSETATTYAMKFDVPGLTKDQIKIDLHDNTLTVSGERKEEKKEEDKKRHYTEISYGSFMRSFTFPTKVDPERVEAKYENGLLNITLQKTEAQKARQITVK